jgi:hypothetical protein
MWIVIFNALDDFGIREVNDVVRTGSPGNEHPNYSQIEAIKKKVSDDALHGALRIAGLVRNTCFRLRSPSDASTRRACFARTVTWYVQCLSAPSDR